MAEGNVKIIAHCARRTKQAVIESFKTETPKVWWEGTQETPPQDRNMRVPDKAAKKPKAILKSLDAVRSFKELKETFSANSFDFQEHKEKGDDWWEIRASGNCRLLFHFDEVTFEVTGIEHTDRTH